MRFYRCLGFRPTIRRRTRIGVFAQLEHSSGRFTLELNQFWPGTAAYEPYRRGSEMDHFGFWVDDVDAWVRRLGRVGGTVRWATEDCRIVIPPRPSFPGRAAMVADPDGIWVELMGPRAARRSRTRARARSGARSAPPRPRDYSGRRASGGRAGS